MFNLFLSYVHSPEFVSFMSQTAMPLILITLLVSTVALLLEMRLPIRYYWGLPGHSLTSFLRSIKLMPAVPVWGRCTLKGNNHPMPLVACDLLDERSKKVLRRTYSNHQGEFGFSLVPGKYLLRAVKTRYAMPSFLDPENVEVYEVDESFATPVIVLNNQVAPTIDIPLSPIKTMQQLNSWEATAHYGRMFLFQLANVLLFVDIILSLLGWWSVQDAFYGLILAVSVVLLFIKLYILETISHVAEPSHA